ncbi:unnamed protein product [Vitrella brassicaformis CCMP3155]|uniref:Acetyl-coenzyme A synthetase n=1 Tax=Vitrella brassicaformis (strain CCMP3155) TaxID=1169540 RepID=A0A0G4FAE2_VITBC|nr:unnamed protein product [Vitrella brassicaformis CCMP3155]|mmetsp:Transcript_45400/g.112776  ORF Transcript_45400/g.112776 Transcript_45400/m.112776 type:complete len:692 (-) Transcript_45400:468-2543(-)|eukprot:CEM09953.1 unnamed protein product [Vitrella brassicaformis CCMP3155]
MPRTEHSGSPSVTRERSPPPSIEHVDTIAQAAAALPVDEVYNISLQNKERCHIYSMECYEQMYHRSIKDSDNFWRDIAMSTLRWLHPFTKVQGGDMHPEGDVSWFINGKLNVCDNCVDRWAEVAPERIAIIWEGDDPQHTQTITYKALLNRVCKFANMLKRLGVRRYDTVGIYMPMIPETIYAMLACARLGAIHSVVFAGFSAPNLRDRLIDAHCKIVITADQGIRGGKIIPLKNIMDEALKECPLVDTCVVFQHQGQAINWIEGRDVWGHEMLDGMRPYCPLEIMDSEDLLFMLYTSGSTGKPKGIAHSSAGYLLYTALTFKYVFDFHPGDIHACVADVGWITGHSYIVYGPLCNGATTVVFESVPMHPNPSRYWQLCERWRVSQFYTAPTAIRALMIHGTEWVENHDLSSLRVLGTVGEPINPEAWRWYYEVVGKSRCDIVDTYWQTETGGHMLTPLPGAIKCKPGSATRPFFGVEPVILDSKTGKPLHGNNVNGVLCFRRPWPGMMRTVYGDHERLLNVYLRPYPGYYFTGDGCVRDKDGYYWITGRVDDTINVSGHRLGSAEVEHALVQHKGCSEAAVVGYPHSVKGTGLFCFVTMNGDYEVHAGTTKELRDIVRKEIGPIATPDYILITPTLPKTRSGKIIRRLLRKIAASETDSLGDLSTLGEGGDQVVHTLIQEAKKLTTPPTK